MISQNILIGGRAKTPLLSIIVPVYNVEKYLRECLDSLVNQTLQNIEIIVVNDCSPDNSEAIVLEYVAKDDRIVYIKHEQNKCLGGARNTGIKEARGKYIAFVDSDDYVDRHLYEAAVSAFEEHNVDVVSVPFIKFDEEGRVESFYRPCEKVYRVSMDDLLEGTFYSAWSKVYRTADLRDKDIVFPEHMYWEDVPFWIEYCALMHPRVWNLSNDYGYYQYRQRTQSITGQGYINHKDSPRIFTFAYQNLNRRGLMNKDLFFSFYKIVMQTILGAWNLLDRKYRMELSENFFDFTRQITFGPTERRVAPLWYRMSRMTSGRQQRLFMYGVMRRLKLKAKIKHIIHYIHSLSSVGGGGNPRF